jgi:hypothetical protein
LGSKGPTRSRRSSVQLFGRLDIIVLVVMMVILVIVLVLVVMVMTMVAITLIVMIVLTIVIVLLQESFSVAQVLAMGPILIVGGKVGRGWVGRERNRFCSFLGEPRPERALWKRANKTIRKQSRWHVRS